VQVILSGSCQEQARVYDMSRISVLWERETIVSTKRKRFKRFKYFAVVVLWASVIVFIMHAREHVQRKVWKADIKQTDIFLLS